MEDNYITKEYTISDFLREFNITLTELARRVGLSISLLSKIKNGVERITDKTRLKFKYAFPLIKLVGGAETWKIKYFSEVEKNEKLEHIIDIQTRKINTLEIKISKIMEICKND